MRLIKPSSYNYRTTLPAGIGLLFNFYSLRLMGVSPKQAESVGSILDQPNAVPEKKKDARLRQLLIDKGFLIDDEVDELDYLKCFHHQACTQTRNFSLTILPSLACNFRCTYCYESPSRAAMSTEVQDALVSLVRQRVVQNGSFLVTWFGGEPLLRMDIIERLSKAFMELCSEHNARYSASVITNGSLLTRKMARKLVDFNVTRVQVTLDGPPEIHDSRRPLVSGGKTFSKIFRNLKVASPILPINLRINVDNTNREHIPEVLDLIEQAGLKGMVRPYLGHTLPYNEVCGDVAGCCLSDEDFSLLELETDFDMIKRGFGSYHMPRSTNVYCMADNNNSYGITPDGGVVKCWNDAANPEAEIGHLIKPYTEEMRSNAERWLMRDPFNLECARCILLPICMGGCPYLFLKTGRLHCHDWKYHLKENLAIYYYIRKLQQESEIARSFLQIVDRVKDMSSSPDTGSTQG
jgi:uncharacterized protein